MELPERHPHRDLEGEPQHPRDGRAAVVPGAQEDERHEAEARHRQGLRGHDGQKGLVEGLGLAAVQVTVRHGPRDVEGGELVGRQQRQRWQPRGEHAEAGADPQGPGVGGVRDGTHVRVAAGAIAELHRVGAVGPRLHVESAGGEVGRGGGEGVPVLEGAVLVVEFAVREAEAAHRFARGLALLRCATRGGRALRRAPGGSLVNAPRPPHNVILRCLLVS